MSTLEKFGILVILILVVIIGVVAVWGVGGEDRNPFEGSPAGGDAVATAPGDPAAPDAKATDPAWPGAATAVNTAPSAVPTGPVNPPVVQSGVTPAAGPEAAGRSAAESGFTTYRIQKGDTLAAIAQRIMGDRNKWKQIVDANPGLDARRLKIDMEIRVPSGTAVASVPGAPKPSNSFAPTNPDDGPTGPARDVPPPPVDTGSGKTPPPAASAGREVEVRSGDTLYEIARRELGDPNLYIKIMKANPGLDPKRLHPGQKVRLPE
jgi:nucleoid-associated protein YgaU